MFGRARRAVGGGSLAKLPRLTGFGRHRHAADAPLMGQAGRARRHGFFTLPIEIEFLLKPVRAPALARKNLEA